MGRPHVLMSVMRHEGWHAAQDCMAGTIDNSLIAIILPEESVPEMWQEMVRRHMHYNQEQFHGRRKQCGQVRLNI